jgi:broad specificity phosphatase PhoE
VGTLYLIRHGQASYGEPDYDRLSARGVEQALAIGRWAATENIGALYCGPIGVAVGLVFGIPAERAVRTSIVVRNASITELRFRSQGFDWQPDQLSLVTFNLTAHLPDELRTER